MDNYLIDRDTLSQFVDELIKRKALPVNSPEELDSLREQAIEDLDEAIGVAIFSRLTKEQYAELSQLSDDPDTPPEAFDKFFENAGLDIDQIITDALKAFGLEFLGGQDE